MKFVFAFLFAMLVAMAAAASTAAHEYTAGVIKVVHPWTRATPPGATTAVAYAKLTNTGRTPVRLVGGATPLAQRIEIHTMSIEGGIMRMRPIPSIDIAPGQTVALKPGGLHLMLIGLNRQLPQEDLVPMTLIFGGGLTVQVELYVEGMDAGPGAHDHQ